MSNQVALITGGATGIGKAVALKLAAKGVTVIMSGRRAEVGKAAVAEVSAAARNGAQVRFVQNNVADEAAVKMMIDSIVAEFGRLDMAVNNAGVSNETGTLVQSSSDSVGSEKSTSMPSASRLKSSMMLSNLKLLPFSNWSCMKSIDHT